MFASNSWSPSKRRTYSTARDEVDDLYGSATHSKSAFRPSRSSSNFLQHLSRNLYLRYFLSLLVGLFLGRTIFAPMHYQLPSLPYRNTEPKVDTTTNAPHSGWSNSTLGTAAIIALNSPSRPDRRDYLALMAAMTDIKLTWMDARTSAPIAKALPHEHNPGLKDVEYACWRTHADAWRKVVEEGWDTAMIMEDDADWDGGIHEQMTLAWEALTQITNDPTASTEAKSYFPTSIDIQRVDDRWDIFYTGTCMDYPAPDYLLINDPQLPQTSTWWLDAIYTQYFATTAVIRRLIQPSIEPVCTHSYIVSQTGARKLLFHTNMFLPWGVDVAIIKLINKGTIKGYSIIPPLFVSTIYVSAVLT